jgi:D-alanyl-lipoteichoic acid acyltransferase DltB (MBOAT superfamily)
VLFASYGFLGLFLPAVLLGCRAAGRLGRRAVLVWLMLASAAFYASYGAAFLPLVAASIGGNFLAARQMRRWADRPNLRTAVLAGAIGTDLALLVWGKFGAAVLPPGLSFLTFTQIGYLLDCGGPDDAGGGLLDYALFAGFFPHVIAGPIPLGHELLPRLRDARPLRPGAEDLAAGGGIFVIGLLKKTLLADPLGLLVDPGFAHPQALSLLPAWQAALAWSLQLYFDFSGYSDMAIGLGRMVGLRYPANFASPYQAQSIIDYWQRWHITLTRFLTRRLYAPMTLAVMRFRRARGWPVNRSAQQRWGGFLSMLALPLLATMALAGVWHGSGLTFLVFGLLHGGFLTVNHAWRLFRPGRRRQTAAAIAGRIGLTYLCVLTGAVVFRAASMGDALAVFAGMLGGHGIDLTPADMRGLAHAWLDALWLAGLFGIVWLAPNTQQIMLAADGGRWSWRPSVGWAVASGLAAALGLVSLGGTGEFVYFQF